MEKQNDIRERVKYEVKTKNVYETGINYRVHKYMVTKYMNVINEISLINEILEYCKEDEPVKKDYLEELKSLHMKKNMLADMLREMDEQEIEK